MFEFHKHHDFEGKHAFLSPSSYHWIRYDEDKLRAVYSNHLATLKGTELHALAAKLIANKVKLPRTRQTLNMYVNDAIGYGLTPEQVLVYSENCFGTADAIGVKGRTLYIFDLKTGSAKASLDQLKVYAALFCLEYNIDPTSFEDIDMRIYQANQVSSELASLYEIQDIMKTIEHFDAVIDSMKEV